MLIAVAGVGAREAAQGWAPAQRGYRLSLPRDHGAHPQHRIEWWYYTGNVEGAGGQRYGYQLTFFRVGVHPQPANPSRWAVRDLYMAHFAITDVGGRRYRASDRLNRAGVGWAGASSGTLEVWNEDWSARLSHDGSHVLRARDGDMAIDLVLAPGKPFVAHGDAGYSQKGSTEGNASHYYSLTRMPTRGTVTVNGRSVTVQGESWMDHEFGSSFLEAGQQGWDWLIHLDDRTDLMLFQIRGGGAAARLARRPRRAPSSAGGAVGRVRTARCRARRPRHDAGGRRVHAGAGGADVADERGQLPGDVEVTVPSLDLRLDVRGVLDGQELHTAESTNVTYWEGAIDVSGTRAGRRVGGRGYLEMTGYTGAPMSDVLR
jgi:predicted secreted hydrolase